MKLRDSLAGIAALTLAACGTSGDDAAEPADDYAAAVPQEETSVDSVSVDALVPGTDYHATAQIPCGFGGNEPTSQCDAGVKRNWAEDGTTLVEVQKPDGFKRAIFFKGTEPYGADSAEADGSAGWNFRSTRDGDRVTIRFGPETYVVFDALVEGG